MIVEIENHFYHAHRELDKLFYEEEEMQMPRKLGRLNVIQKETAASSFAAFSADASENQIDFFFRL